MARSLHTYLILIPLLSLSSPSWTAEPLAIADARLLMVSAHPDDEGIFGGGTLAHYSQSRNFQVVQMTMVTRDPTGSDPLSPDRVGELMAAVDRYAGAAINGGTSNAAGHYVTGNITFVEGGFIDTGCCSPDPQHSWDGWGANPSVTLVSPGFGNTFAEPDGKLAAAIAVAREIRRYRPEVVVTPHDLEGDYGHSNHTATSIAAIEGVALASDATLDIDGLAPWSVQKLYLRGSLDDNRPGIFWGSFSSDGGISALFHDFWELAIIGGAKAREIGDFGLRQHLSQEGIADLSTVYQPFDVFDGHHSEWWTLYRSNVGPDALLDFSVAGTDYLGWARGEFFENTGTFLPPLPPEPPLPRAMSAWSFDENLGNVTEDRVGVYDGIISGGEWVPGVRGSALRLSGTGEVVFDGFDLDSDWTAAMWVRREASTGVALLLSTARSALKLEQGPYVGYTLYGFFDDAFSLGTPLGDWTHLTFVRENATMSLYVNCIPADSLMDVPSRVVPLPRDRLGRRNNGFNGLVGSVDEVVLWRGALNAAGVHQLCNAPGTDVVVDVKPGSDTNPINLRSRGVVPVAVLGSYTLDVRHIDVASLSFGAASPSHLDPEHFEDVNDDGFPDLVTHYSVQETGISPGDTEACLAGNLEDGTAISACDVIDTSRGR